MAHKQVLFRSIAREKILRGTTQLCDAVRFTLGPKSKSVLIQKSWGTPIVCNDGVTIAKGMSRSLLNFVERALPGSEGQAASCLPSTFSWILRYYVPEIVEDFQDRTNASQPRATPEGPLG